MAPSSDDHVEAPNDDAIDPTKPDVKAAAAAVRERRGEEAPKKKRGRPKGSGKAKPQEPAPPPAEVTESDIAAAGKLGGLVWKMVGKVVGMRELSKDERQEFGEALAPVLAKYMPLANEYAPEIGLAFTIFTLYEKTKLPKKPPVIPPTGGADAEELKMDFEELADEEDGQA